jgi:hypothetical protein
MKKIFLLIIPVLFFSCKQENNQQAQNKYIMNNIIKEVIDTLVQKNGTVDKEKITKGVTQAAGFWTEADGTQDEFKTFCFDSYISSKDELESNFQKLMYYFENMNGGYNKIMLQMQRYMHLDLGPLSKVDEMFASFDATAHYNDDMFANKIAFYIILNYPHYTLKEKTEKAANWNRTDWAYARLGDVFTSRVPAQYIQAATKSQTESDMYISEFNIYVGELVTEKGEKIFPEGMKLLSHWGLRDELKANYGKENGLEKQMMIYEVMKNIISQQIPQQVINNDSIQWNPYTNKVYNKGKEISSTPTQNTRYVKLLNNFNALKAEDPYYTDLNTYIKRKFEGEMELEQEDVEKLFIEFVSSPEVKQIGELIKKRLGRDLKPFDIWYDGFKARSAYSSEVLTKEIEKKYPNNLALKADMENILKRLQFPKEKAAFIATKIDVDPARGSGHAWGAQMHSENSHLRTRIPASGMNYEGYNVAMHEFGHNVEQTISLHDVDNYALTGVPNTAFTEALAFIFQRRDLEILGKVDNDINKESLMALDNFWSLYEIMGVSLVDMNVWKWLYSNPNATDKELKEAVLRISIDIWNKYYADVFGVKDQPILAIYSHMISYPLYLSAYSFGHLIDFQIEQYIKGKPFGKEIERIYSIGKLTPQEWMKQAVGAEISIQPMLTAVDEALKIVKN